MIKLINKTTIIMTGSDVKAKRPNDDNKKTAAT